MPNTPVEKHGDIGRSAADVNNGHTQIALIIVQHGKAGGIRLQHNVRHFVTGLVDAIDDVFGRSYRSGNNVHFRFQTNPGHADGIFNAILIINRVLLRQHMDDFTIHGHGNGLRRIDHPFHIFLGDYFVFTANGNYPRTVKRTNMVTGNACVNTGNFVAAGQLRLFNGMTDGIHRFFNIHDHAAAQPVRGIMPDADNV